MEVEPDGAGEPGGAGQGAVKPVTARRKQAVMNLVLNAIQATPPGGWVRIEVGERAGDGVLTVQDCGSGLSLEARSHLFEPFFATKELGSGLGLLQVHAVVEQYGGSVAVQDGNAGGACLVGGLPPRAAA